jgi:hypothetical protein
MPDGREPADPAAVARATGPAASAGGLDAEGVLRTDHVPRLWSATAGRPLYKLDRPGRTMQV